MGKTATKMLTDEEQTPDVREFFNQVWAEAIEEIGDAPSPERFVRLVKKALASKATAYQDAINRAMALLFMEDGAKAFPDVKPASLAKPRNVKTALERENARHHRTVQSIKRGQILIFSILSMPTPMGKPLGKCTVGEARKFFGTSMKMLEGFADSDIIEDVLTEHEAQRRHGLLA